MAQSLVFKYDGESFPKVIILRDLSKALEGIREAIEVFNSDGDLTAFIEPFEEGSFGWKVVFKSKEFKAAVAVGVIFAPIQLLPLVMDLFRHVDNAPFTTQINNINGTVDVINVHGDVKNNLPLNVVEYLNDEKLKKAGAKIVSPLKLQGDNLCLGETNNTANKFVIEYDNKAAFGDAGSQEKKVTIRGKMYELNLKQGTFKVELYDNPTFTVHLAQQSNDLKIQDFIPFLDTSDIELTGLADVDSFGKIHKLTLHQWRIVQNRFDFGE